VTSGDLRRLPAPLGWRVVQAVTLLLLLRGLTTLLLRYLVRYRHQATLQLGSGILELSSTQEAWGRTLRTSHRVLPLGQLVEVALEEHGEDLRFPAGLVGLFLGTTLGFGLLVQSAQVASPALFVWGSSLMACGVLADFFVGSARVPPHFSGRAQLLVQPGSRGFTLAGVDLEAAQRLMAEMKRQLTHSSSESHTDRQPAP